MLQEVDPEESGKDVTVRDVLDSAAVRVHEDFQDRPLLEARLRSMIGQVYLRLTVYEPAQEHLEWALDTRMELLGPDDPATVWTMSRLGELHLGAVDGEIEDKALHRPFGRDEVPGHQHVGSLIAPPVAAVLVVAGAVPHGSVLCIASHALCSRMPERPCHRVSAGA